MRTARNNHLDESLSLRFILPVLGENMLTIAVGLVFSQIISTISGSALAAIGMANTVQTVVFALFTVVTSGASVLVSRLIGENKGTEAADVVEQSTLLALISATALMLVTILCASPIMRLLMPTAEDALFGEATRYFSILMLSLPAYVLHSVLSAVFRAMGNGKTPLRVALLMNGVQLLAGFVLISWCGLEEVGAGLAYVICRLFGAALMVFTMLRNHHHFVISIRRIFRFQVGTMRRIIHIGIPQSIESVGVNLGYMLANSMSIALGTTEASVYQILTTVNTFTTLPQSACVTIATTAAGHLIGAKRYADVRRAGWRVWFFSMTAIGLLGLFAVIFGTEIASIYSSDPVVIATAAGMMWLLPLTNLPGQSINTIDPQLRAGGDVRFVMYSALTVVWGVRLPLTYLFCFVLNMGVAGIFYANTIALCIRMVAGFVRYSQDGWMRKKV